MHQLPESPSVPLPHADALRAMGSGFNLPQVQAFYEPLLARQPRDGVQLHTDLPYGPDERQVLDVYQPTQPAADGRPWPVLVMFHGGGFIRGDKRARANMGWHFARQGVLTVVPNYRLAPASVWPSGPQDVVLVWQWLQAQAANFQADARRCVLAGESAGAAHVAAATLLRRFQPAGLHVAGAVLMSGPYNARLEGLSRAQFGTATPDPRNEAYFGPDPAAWDAASIVDHIDAAPLPMLITFAQRDLLQMQVQAGELFGRLVSRHGFAPQLQCLPEHNHFSGGHSVGTEDTSVSSLLARFIHGACAS
jgi:acetyl esterase